MTPPPTLPTPATVDPPRGPSWRSALAARNRSTSRATRDTLFLLAVLAWTLGPHLARIPPWCSALAVAALVWRAGVAWRGTALPSRAALLGALLLACGVAWASHSSLNSKDTGVTLLVVLAALKTLELRARRDATVVFFLGFVLVLTNFLYSQSIVVAVAMALSVLGLLTALLLAQLPDLPAAPGPTADTSGPAFTRAPPADRPPGLALAAGLALRQLLVGLPLVALLFLLFPRLPPLWGVAGDSVGRTGLSDRLELGQVAELAGDDTLVARVRFLGAMPPREALYFRGPVLSRHDGRSWTTLPDLGVDKLSFVQGATLAYEMTVEPLRLVSLPLLELSLEAPQVTGAELRLTLRDDLHWQPDRLITDRLRVRARASLAVQQVGSRLPMLHEEQVELPPKAHPRTRAWARAWLDALPPPATGPAPPRGSAAHADRVVHALLDHIRTQDYRYTLNPGADVSPEAALDAFWLDRRAGFCEHYAASFVVILRSLGIPARIVTGYLGGQLNEVDGQLELRQSDAHAWAEYWRPGQGWVRADPTGAVAPERVMQSQRPTPRRSFVAGALSQVSPGLVVQWQSWRDLWSAVEQRWNDGVLNYSSQRQRDWLTRLGFEDVDTTLLLRLMGGTLAVVGLAAAAWAAWQGRRRRQGDAWLREWRTLQDQLAAKGLAVAAHHSPRAVAAQLRRTTAHTPPAAPRQAAQVQLAELLEQFEAWRYAPRTTPAAARTLRPLLRRIRARTRALQSA